MIPQTKIDQAAGDYRDGLLKEKNRTTGQFVGIPPTHKEIEAMVIGYADGMTAGVRFAESEMGQIAQEFAELLYTWESKLELLNVSIANLSEAADPNTMTTFTVLQYQQMQLTQCIEGLRPIIAKFMEERNQPTCHACGSTRILDWPDKYQCRRCEHVWRRG